MMTCPICGAQTGSPVCDCGYDRSRDYAAYPTLAPLPQGLPTFEALYADVAEPRMAFVKCPDCGREAVIYEDQNRPKCTCGAPLNPTHYFTSLYQTFHNDFDAEQVSDRILNAIHNHEKLLDTAEKALTHIRYASPEAAKKLEDALFDLALFAGNETFALLLKPFRPLYDKMEAAIRNQEIGHNIFDEQEEENRERMNERKSILLDAGFRYHRGAWHFPPFDPDEYRCHTQSQLYRDAVAAEARGDYRTAYEILEQYWTDLHLIDDEKALNPYAITHLAMLYHYGRGCEQDRYSALDLFDSAANLGSPLAAAWITEYYRMGYVVEKDRVFARKLYEAVDPELQKMCEAGDAEAQYFRGFGLIYGANMEADLLAGVELMLLAQHQGHRNAAVELAYCYYNGEGVAKDRAAAFKLLTEYPIPSDSRKAQYLLGLCYYWGNGTKQNYDLAFPCFKRAAELGHGTAKDYLGDCYRLGEGTPQDDAEAARWYRDAADHHGNANSALQLGFMYTDGRGVEQDDAKAVHYWRIAAEGGDAAAQNQLGFAYMEGKGVAADRDTALSWFKKAADANYAPAQFWLGYHYLLDDDSTLHQQGLALLTRSAEAGHEWAQYKLGHLYELGHRVPADDRKAFEWYQKAADQNLADAQCALGLLYLKGKGTDRDPEKAIANLTKALYGGHQPAARELAKCFHHGIADYKGQPLYTDPTLAHKCATIAVQKDSDGEAQYLMGRIIHYDLGTPRDAVDWYRRAIQNGCMDAKPQLSKVFIQLRENLDEAWQLLRSDNTPKTAEVCYLISLCLEKGWGTQKDKRRAKEYYNRAIEKGYVDNNPKKKKLFGLF